MVRSKTSLQKVPVAIILSFRFGQGQIANYMVDAGTFLEISVCWPQKLIDIK